MNTQNFHFCRRWRSVPRKIFASLVVLAFIFTQTIPAGFADITLRPETRVTPYQPETEATGDAGNTRSPQQPSVPVDASTAFLQN